MAINKNDFGWGLFITGFVLAGMGVKSIDENLNGCPCCYESWQLKMDLGMIAAGVVFILIACLILHNSSRSRNRNENKQQAIDSPQNSESNNSAGKSSQA